MLQRVLCRAFLSISPEEQEALIRQSIRDYVQSSQGGTVRIRTRNVRKYVEARYGVSLPARRIANLLKESALREDWGTEAYHHGTSSVITFVVRMDRR